MDVTAGHGQFMGVIPAPSVSVTEVSTHLSLSLSLFPSLPLSLTLLLSLSLALSLFLSLTLSLFLSLALYPSVSRLERVKLPRLITCLCTRQFLIRSTKINEEICEAHDCVVA